MKMQNISFGRVFMDVDFTKSTEEEKEKKLDKCRKLENKYRKDKNKRIIMAIPYHDRKTNVLESYDMTMDCKDENGETDVEAEKQLMTDLRYWANQNGFEATIKRYDFSPL